MHSFFRSALLALVVTSGVASAADISSNVIVTAKGMELFQAWENNPTGGFTIVPVKTARRGEFLSAIVMFMDCAPGTDGNCNADLDITTYDPNGKVYGRLLGIELWRGKSPPIKGHYQLSVGYMGLVIEPDDPPGKYKVVATAKDLVSGKSSVSETSFKVE